jgi:4'-phosphopantetheinyl transferase
VISGLPEPAFLPPPARLAFGPLHVWRFVTADCSVLSDAEQARAEEFRSGAARDAFVVGRSGIRRAVAAYTGRDARELVISEASSGKPFLADAGIHFNLSHSGGNLVAAFSSEPVGIDIESPGRCRDFAGVARRFFHPDEAARIGGEEGFLLCWTAKEAMLKLDGGGLAGGMDRALVLPGGGGMLDGKPVGIARFRIGARPAAVATFSRGEVKGWFEI